MHSIPSILRRLSRRTLEPPQPPLEADDAFALWSALPIGMPPPGQLLAWMRAIVERRLPAPEPLVNLAAACVHATGAAADFARAQAVVALQSGRFAA